MCKCILVNSNAPAKRLCSETNKCIFCARASADLNVNADSLKMSIPISYIAILAPSDELLLLE
ncbi:hypothetical protein [Escherichia coli]|uniref:hypothetical protein n=1 Tax=Escherichia coli TaxID=562 RepID=UPI0038600B58